MELNCRRLQLKSVNDSKINGARKNSVETADQFDYRPPNLFAFFT